MRASLRAWRDRSTRKLLSRLGRRPWSWLKWPALSLVSLLMLVIFLSFFLDEPIRRYVEHEMNRSMKGYTAHIRAARFHPIGLSLTLKDLSFVQDARPDPPVLQVPRLDASVHWKAVIFGRIVADFVVLNPVLYADRRQVEAEAADPTPLEEHGWQEAFHKIYPLKINRVRISNGRVTYIDEGPFKPLELRGIQVLAENIRNIRSKEHTYPSLLRVVATVFEKGRITIDGHADFLAEPHPGVKANIALEMHRTRLFQARVARPESRHPGRPAGGRGDDRVRPDDPNGRPQAGHDPRGEARLHPHAAEAKRAE
jgi:hypothetical protein